MKALSLSPFGAEMSAYFPCFKKSFGRLLAGILSAAMLAGLLLSASASARTAPVSAEPLTAEDPYSALRLHIIANSDSAEDQAAKLCVRDAVLQCVRERFEGAENSAEAEEILLAMGDELLECAKKALASCGTEHDVQLIDGEFSFPDRLYEGLLYPAGSYRALRIIIGAGEGHNWWCVMFPPLCIIDDGNGEASVNPDGTLEFKSFFAELFEKLFG